MNRRLSMTIQSSSLCRRRLEPSYKRVVAMRGTTVQTRRRVSSLYLKTNWSKASLQKAPKDPSLEHQKMRIARTVLAKMTSQLKTGTSWKKRPSAKMRDVAQSTATITRAIVEGALLQMEQAGSAHADKSLPIIRECVLAHFYIHYCFRFTF